MCVGGGRGWQDWQSLVQVGAWGEGEKRRQAVPSAFADGAEGIESSYMCVGGGRGTAGPGGLCASLPPTSLAWPPASTCRRPRASAPSGCTSSKRIPKPSMPSSPSPGRSPGPSSGSQPSLSPSQPAPPPTAGQRTHPEDKQRGHRGRALRLRVQAPLAWLRLLLPHQRQWWRKGQATRSWPVSLPPSCPQLQPSCPPAPALASAPARVLICCPRRCTNAARAAAGMSARGTCKRCLRRAGSSEGGGGVANGDWRWVEGGGSGSSACEGAARGGGG